MTIAVGMPEPFRKVDGDEITIQTIRKYIVGKNEEIPLLGGVRRPYINLDNAASTPTISIITDKVNEFLKWYSNVHRGTDFKSKLSSWVFEEARDTIAKFVNADLSDSVVLFCKNTTEAINKLAHRFSFQPGDVVLTSVMSIIPTNCRRRSTPSTMRSGCMKSLIAEPSRRNSGFDTTLMRCVLALRSRMIAATRSPVSTGTVDLLTTTVSRPRFSAIVTAACLT